MTDALYYNLQRICCQCNKVFKYGDLMKQKCNCHMCKNCFDIKKKKDSVGDKIEDECYCCSKLDTKKLIMESSTIFHNAQDRNYFLDHEAKKYDTRCMSCQGEIDNSDTNNIRRFKVTGNVGDKDFIHIMCIKCYQNNKEQIKKKKKPIKCELCKREEFLEKIQSDGKCNIF